MLAKSQAFFCLKKPQNGAFSNRPHLLSGNYSGFWECHIKPDWLLIYQFSEETNENGEVIEFVTFVRTGTHSDLFG
jgi:mRNA interferase YafQ